MSDRTKKRNKYYVVVLLYITKYMNAKKSNEQRYFKILNLSSPTSEHFASGECDKT